MRRACIINGCPIRSAGEPFAFSADTVAALTHMGYHVVPLEPWGAGNAAEVIGIAPADAALARALGFPGRESCTARATRARPRALAMAPCSAAGAR